MAVVMAILGEESVEAAMAPVTDIVKCRIMCLQVRPWLHSILGIQDTLHCQMSHHVFTGETMATFNTRHTGYITLCNVASCVYR